MKKHAKPKAKPKAAAQKPAAKQQGGVAGVQTTGTPRTARAASESGSTTNWQRIALLLAMASILGVIAMLFVTASWERAGTAASTGLLAAVAGLRRGRRAPARDVTTEVLGPASLRAPIALPPVPRTEPAATERIEAPTEERPTDQLLEDIAPAVPAPPSAPAPLTARPPFHEPAIVGTNATRQTEALRETTSPDETAPLVTPAAADNGVIAQPIDDICEINIWRGYVKSRFYAGLVGGQGQGIEYALAESQPIRLRGSSTPDRTPTAEEAHHALVAYLLDSGWEPEPQLNGENWYALRFRRTAEVAEVAEATSAYSAY